MSAFLIRRIVLAIPVLFGILLVTFTLNRLIPGDPCRAVLGERATDQVCDAYLARYGLNEPVPVQFMYYVRNIAQGDLGTSLRFSRSVTELLAERLPVTMELAASALIIAVIAGIPMGVISAYRRNSSIDVGTMIFANVGVSMPVFWLGLMLAFLFGVILKDTPLALPPSGRLTAGSSPEPFYLVWGLVSEAGEASTFMRFIAGFNVLNAILTLNTQLLIDAMRHLILPAVAVGTIPLAIIARMTRSSLLDALGQDYTRTARAKGLREVTVVIGHAVRNSLLPVVTIIGLSFGGLVSGAVLTETIFGFTGIGRTLFDGITARDYTLVQGVTLVTAVAFVVINLIVDVLYGYLDPRIRLS
ncbi:MAG: peptide ABC transporter permease [Anaerolineaceae bacterium]|nr:peptide ABC transporter permease [Anaerolineaceae bacterium]